MSDEKVTRMMETLSGSRPLYPETALDALQRWDSGDSVFTIEMGGMGPGYEQAIQLLVFEIIRDHHTDKLLDTDKKESLDFYWRTFGEKAITRTDRLAGGYSGAQVGAAKSIAFRAIRDGWRGMLESAPMDRHIQVSRSFPQAPPIPVTFNRMGMG